MQDFRNLEVWQLSRPLVVAVYKTLRTFPDEERFGLCFQLRKSVSAIGANIAEGFGRGSRADTARCLQIAISEGNETLHHLITAMDLEYLTPAKFDELEEKLGPVRRKLTNLLFKIRPAPRKNDKSAPKARPRT
jgi:four helix bundle protein